VTKNIIVLLLHK